MSSLQSRGLFFGETAANEGCGFTPFSLSSHESKFQHMVRLALFDIDGTLVHTGGAGVKAFSRAFQSEFGIPDGTRLLKFAGRTDGGLVRELFAQHGIQPTQENLRRFFDCYVFWLDYLLGERSGKTCPGAEDFVHKLRRLPEPPAFGLLTGNIRLGAEIKLRHFNLWEHFSMGAFGDDHHERNQLAVIAHQRGNRHLNHNLRGEEVLVIGDTPLDIECARAIGARCLAVATGGSTLVELNEHQPTWAVADLQQIHPAEVCR
jgi:phosphoglycolate phosphatase